MTWYIAAKIGEFTQSYFKTLFIDDIKILLIKHGERFYALEDLCTHDGGDLSGAEIDGDEIICPRHGARFCISTGEVRTPPAYEDIQAFKVKIENETIFIEV